ncbi:F-box domain-containing protein [Mycena kentingensis (nom. inval.)]|nr:F-box domain-containing protein [Mycena kentingensis (nom. inval.)]
MKYESIPRIFSQGAHGAVPDAIGAAPPRFGLLDSSERRWPNLLKRIKQLNERETGAAIYKLIIFARHGQGVHNVAEAKYGSGAWNERWAMLEGDGELTWGPDPSLTSLGECQATDVNALWHSELAAGAPLPEKLYCSPLTRALQTQQITFAGIQTPRVVILENCREEYGAHTCDRRRSKTLIQQRFPEFDVEAGFAEEDKLHTQVRETSQHVTRRAKLVLDHIFTHDVDSVVISITAHGGIINGFLRAMGRDPYGLPTGGVLPVVVRGWCEQSAH